MSNVLFVLTRHGRTQGNEKNVYRGWSNQKFAQLDDDGRNDAKEAGIFLKGLGYPFAAILVDDLERTQETAHIIAKTLGMKEDQIITDRKLRPVDVGDYTGQSKSEHPLEEYMNNPSKVIPGGESLGNFDKRQAQIFADILELVATLRKPVLVVGHGSNASFLYHKVNKGGKEVGYEGMTEPGGIMTFSKSGLDAIFKKREKKDSEANKLDQATVLYMTAEEIGSDKGAHCDDCWKYIGSKNEPGKCADVAGSIDPEKGVCGLYAYGEPNQLVRIGTIPQSVAGYFEKGPTKCELCEYFGGENRCAKVKSAPKKIEAGGCCNAFEAKKEEKKPSREEKK
jgi:broad specificity phosphatase PhoE